MPLEIGQLIINARVIPDNNTPTTTAMPSSQDNPAQQSALIERCVAEVLRILEDRQER